MTQTPLKLIKAPSGGYTETQIPFPPFLQKDATTEEILGWAQSLPTYNRIRFEGIARSMKRDGFLTLHFPRPITMEVWDNLPSSFDKEWLLRPLTKEVWDKLPSRFQNQWLLQFTVGMATLSTFGSRLFPWGKTPQKITPPVFVSVGFFIFELKYDIIFICQKI